MALSDYQPAGLIFPFVGNSVKIFQCPDGIDRTPNSPTNGERFQVGYAMTPQMGGRNLSEYVGVTVFEHDDVPYCLGAASHYTGWPTGSDMKDKRHYPARHSGAFSIARSDGSVTIQR